MMPATVMGEATHHVRQQWEPYEGERLYGLGQHQQGLVDIKGTDLELRQYNGEIFIPLLVSSRGYGILWDNTSLSRFGRTEPPAWEEIPGRRRRRRLDADAHRDRRGRLPAAHVFGAATSRSTSSGVSAPSSSTGVRAGCPGEDVAHVRCSAGQSVRLRFRWKADIGVKIARFSSAAARRERADVALVGGRRRRRLLVHLRARRSTRDRRLPADHRRRRR